MNIRDRYSALAIAVGAIVIGVAARPSHAAQVRASLSSQEAYVGMPITAHVEITNARSHEQPKMPDVAGVDIKTTGAASRSSQMTIINGRRSERTSVTYAWKLTPRRAGEYVVPPMEVEVDGRTTKTRAMRFVANKSETGDLMFVEVEGQQEKIYVGQSLDLTLRIWLKPFHDAKHNVTLSEGDMWQLIARDQSNWGVFAEKIADMDRNRQRAGGQQVLRKDSEGVERQYYQYDVKATIYPKRPGKVDVGDLQVVAKYPTGLSRSRSFFSMSDLAIDRVRPIAADATVAPIEILPVPTEGRPADYRGTVGHYEMITQATPTSVKAGDPITLHIGIRGDGPMELVQSPPLADLEKLTADFKVPDEALAGRVKDDVKLFTVNIRPRREGIAEIPAIPLTYFDPDAERFVTVRSDPIAIEVAAADQLSLSSIIGNATSGGDREDEAAQAPVVYLTNHTGSDVLEPTTASSMWSLVLWLVAAPVVFLVAWGIKCSDAIVARFGGTPIAARRRAKVALAAAHTPHGIATAVLQYIGELLHLQQASLTRDEAIRQLNQRVVIDEIYRVDRLLAACETSSYAGESQADVDLLKSEATECIELLSKHVRAEKNVRKVMGVRSTGFRVSRAALGAGSLLMAVALVGSTTNVRAGELSVDQATQILAEAGDAYVAGQVATEPADAKEAFAAAAQKYQTLVDDSADSGTLYFNLGNAYLQQGDVARALANYQRASALLPGDAQAEKNIAYAESLLGVAPQAPRGVLETLRTWILGISPTTLVVGVCATWIALWAAMIGALFVKRRMWRRIAIPAGVCCTLLAATVVLQWTQVPTEDRGMVVSESAALLAGNDVAFVESGQPVQVGTVFEIVEQRDDWLRVRFTDGEMGWIAADDAEVLPARGWRS